MIIRTAYKLVRDRLKNMNMEKKISMIGIVIGMVMIIFAYRSEYGLYMAITGYVLVTFCSVGYGLFEYFPIIKKSKQEISHRVSQRTFDDYMR